MGEDLFYRVFCGAGNVELDAVEREAVAVVIATDHETVHRCGTWWSRPFDHVAFYAPNADPDRS